jgi:peptidoglycan/LPS O-acetylase OafA/YrhL
MRQDSTKFVKVFSKNSLDTNIKSITAFVFAPTPVGQPRTGRYPNFDILRLLLAVEVVFVHVWSIVDPNFNWPGFVMAVPAFLAISGFLVLQSYSESGSWTVFIKKRILRIIPALLVSFLLCYTLLGKDYMWNSILTWLTGGIYKSSESTNVPLWSLAWEELVYILLAILWLLGAYKKPIWIWLLWIVSIVIVWIGANLDSQTRIILFLGPAFFTGNLMYIYRDFFLGVNRLIPWIFFYFMLQWRFVPDAQLFGGASLLLFQAFAVVWVGMAGAKIIPFKFPDLSYGIYIYHFPIILFLAAKYHPATLFDLGILVVAILIPFSLASWYLIEKPALRFKPINNTANLKE